MQYETTNTPRADVVLPYNPPQTAAPAYQMPLQAPLTGPVQLHGERPAVVWVLDAYGQSVPMLRDQVPAVQPTPVRDLTPVPLIDPRAQLVLAGGVGAGAAGAGIGWGVGQAFAGIAAFGGVTSLAVIAALLLLARLGGGHTHIHNESHVTNTARWFGRSTSTTHQGGRR